MKPTQQALGCCFLRAPVRTSFLVSDSTVGLFSGVESWGNPHGLQCKVEVGLPPSASLVQAVGRAPRDCLLGHRWGEVTWGTCRVSVKLHQRHRHTDTRTCTRGYRHCTHRHTHTHLHTHGHACIDTDTLHTHVHAHTYAHRHMDTRAHTWTCTHRYRHTQTHI